MDDYDATTPVYRRRSVLAGGALTTLGGLSGCLGGSSSASLDATETTRATYVTDNADALALTTTRGAVTVRGARTDDVELTVRAAATDGDGLDEVTTDVSLVGDTLRITADTSRAYTSGAAGSARANLELTVPRTLPVTSVNVPNGDVEIRQVREVGEIDALEGDVAVQDVDGPVAVDAANGSITATNVSGAVSAEGAIGDVTVRKASGRVDARTSAGALTVSDVEDTVEVVTTTGDVEVSRVDGRVAVDTATGDIQVQSVGGDALLATTNGEVKATGVSGEVQRS